VRIEVGVDDGGWLEIRVADTGIGMTDEQASQDHRTVRKNRIRFGVRQEAAVSLVSVLVDTSIWSLSLRRAKRVDDTAAKELTELIREGRVVMMGAIRLQTRTFSSTPSSSS
jgi:hypothetical protein